MVQQARIRRGAIYVVRSRTVLLSATSIGNQRTATIASRLENSWIDVPDDALITVPNRVGRTMVWPLRFDGQILIRCFMPGSMG
jgi:hypothetical protein